MSVVPGMASRDSESERKRGSKGRVWAVAQQLPSPVEVTSMWLALRADGGVLGGEWGVGCRQHSPAGVEKRVRVRKS